MIHDSSSLLAPCHGDLASFSIHSTVACLHSATTSNAHMAESIGMPMPGPRMCHEFFLIITGILLSASQCCLGHANQHLYSQEAVKPSVGPFTVLTFANYKPGPGRQETLWFGPCSKKKLAAEGSSLG